MPTHAFVSHHVVTPDGVIPAAVVVEDGVIIAVVHADQIPAGISVTDFGTLALMPGLVDVHVHVNEPGRTDWEGFETATRAAAAGGVTTLVDMPLNSAPVTTTVAALNEKRRATAGKCTVDVGFHGGLIPGNIADIEPLIDAGVLGMKAFLVHSGIDDFPNATIADIRAAMPILARRGIPLLVHAEWDADIPAPSALGAQRYAGYLASRPSAWETSAIEKMLTLCAEFDCDLHIVHLSATEAVPMLRDAKAKGLPVTVETAPHYLTFDAESVPNGDTRFKCAPPIRSAANRERLWDALRAGTIDLIATDHSPCPPEMKNIAAGDFGAAWGGIPSLQTGLSAVWTGAEARGVDLADVARWMATTPARSVGLQGRKGVIAPGADADFVVFDREATFVVSVDDLHYRHKVTPYEGLRLRGVVRATYLRGQPIFVDGKFPGPPAGSLLARR